MSSSAFVYAYFLVLFRHVDNVFDTFVLVLLTWSVTDQFNMKYNIMSRNTCAVRVVTPSWSRKNLIRSLMCDRFDFVFSFVSSVFVSLVMSIVAFPPAVLSKLTMAVSWVWCAASYSG